MKGRPSPTRSCTTPASRGQQAHTPRRGGHFLDEVIEFNDRGGRANPFLDRDLQPLGLADEDKRALVSFLKTLSGEAASDTR